MAPRNESEIERLLEENTALVRENNVFLRKLYRHSIMEMWLRVLWYAILFGLPFALYFYILEPYFEAYGISLKEFRSSVGEFPWSEIFQKFYQSH